MPRLRTARARSRFTAALAAIAACGTAVWLTADPARATRTTPFDAIAPALRAMSGARPSPGRVRVSGWTAETARGASASDPRALGDRFEASCRAGAPIEDALAASRLVAPSGDAHGGSAVVRRWNEPDEAFVACLVPGDREALHRTLHARSEGGRTQWTMVWSAELASAEALDPERHGRDLPGVPRPAGARRVASGSAGAAGRWVSYDAPRPGAVRRSLEDAGWRASAAQTEGEDTVYTARRGGRVLFVVQRGTGVTVLEGAAETLDGAVNEWRTDVRPVGTDVSGRVVASVSGATGPVRRESSRPWPDACEGSRP